MVAWTLASVASWALILLVPVTFPRPDPSSLDPLHAWVFARVYGLDSAHVTFPCLHAAITWVSWHAIRDRGPKLRAGLFVVAVAITLATMTTRQHSILDNAAGIAIAWACARTVMPKRAGRRDADPARRGSIKPIGTIGRRETASRLALVERQAHGDARAGGDEEDAPRSGPAPVGARRFESERGRRGVRAGRRRNGDGGVDAGSAEALRQGAGERFGARRRDHEVDLGRAKPPGSDDVLDRFPCTLDRALDELLPLHEEQALRPRARCPGFLIAPVRVGAREPGLVEREVLAPGAGVKPGEALAVGRRPQQDGAAGGSERVVLGTRGIGIGVARDHHRRACRPRAHEAVDHAHRGERAARSVGQVERERAASPFNGGNDELAPRPRWMKGPIAGSMMFSSR